MLLALFAILALIKPRVIWTFMIKIKDAVSEHTLPMQWLYSSYNMKAISTVPTFLKDILLNYILDSDKPTK